MNKDIEDKLNWLMGQDVDPKRSQIHKYLSDSPLHKSVAYDLFYFDRYQTIYYDELANWIYDLEEEQWKQYGKRIEDLVNALYKDAKNSNMWGVVYDW